MRSLPASVPRHTHPNIKAQSQPAPGTNEWTDPSPCPPPAKCRGGRGSCRCVSPYPQPLNVLRSMGSLCEAHSPCLVREQAHEWMKCGRTPYHNTPFTFAAKNRMRTKCSMVTQGRYLRGKASATVSIVDLRQKSRREPGITSGAMTRITRAIIQIAFIASSAPGVNGAGPRTPHMKTAWKSRSHGTR